MLPEAVSRGVEASFGLAVTDALTLTGSLAYINAELAADEPDLGGADGDQLPSTPEWEATLGADYGFSVFGWPAHVGASYRYKGEMPVGFDGYTDAAGNFIEPSSPRVDLDAYHLFDLRAGVALRDFDISLYVNNVFDEWAWTSFTPSFAAIPTGAPTQPRTYGGERALALQVSAHMSEREIKPIASALAALGLLGQRGRSMPPPPIRPSMPSSSGRWRPSGRRRSPCRWSATDELFYARGRGVVETGQAAEVDAETLFHIGSVSKAFTAAALGAAGRRRHAELRRPGDRSPARIPHARSLCNARVPDPRPAHPSQAGCRWAPATADVSPGRVDASRDFRGLRHFQPTSSFRSQYDYDNSLYMVAGMVVEEAAGQSFEEFLEERLLLPLGMTDCAAAPGRVDERSKGHAAHRLVDGELETTPTGLLG